MRKQKGKTAFKNRWGEKQPKSIRKKDVNLIDEQNNQKEESQFRQEKKQKERDGRDKLIVILLQCPTDNHQPERYRCRWLRRLQDHRRLQLRICSGLILNGIFNEGLLNHSELLQ